MTRWRSPLRFRLLLLALVAIVPALVVILFDQREERRASRERALADMVQLAHATAENQGATFTGIVRHLVTLSQFPALRAPDPAECNRLFAQILPDRPNYDNLWVSNVDGSSFCAAKPPNPTLSSRTRSWFIRALETRTAVIGDFQIGLAGGKPDVVVAYPLQAPDGKVQRIVAASVGLDNLNRSVATLHLPTGATITLADRQRRILVRYPEPEKWVGKTLPDSLPLPDLSPTAQEQLVDTASVDGTERVYAVVPLRTDVNSGLYLAMGIERDSMFLQSDRMLRGQLWILALVTVLAMGTVWVGGELFVHRPIETLKEATRQIAAGNLAARTQLTRGLPGVSNLAAAVNAMAGTLETRERERDQAEFALQASEYRYRFLFEHNPHPMWVFDRKTLQFLEVNQAAIARYGYSREEFLARRITDIRPDEDIPRLLSRVGRPPAPGWDSAGAWRHLTKSNEVIDVEITSHSLTFDGRSAELVIAQDITRRKRAEEALQAAEERLRFALAAAQVGAWEINMTTNVSHWSETCEVMHGLPAGSFGGNFEAFLACIHPDDRQSVQAAIADAIQEHRMAEFEYRTIWPDAKTERRIAATANFFYDNDGRPLRAAGITVDVTERRSLEDQFRQSQKMEAIGQLAGGVAHDFNNILVAILGNAQFVRDDLPAGDPHRADLEEVIKAAERAASLTHQLLAFSRKQVLAPQVIRLGTVVNDTLPMLKRLLGETIELRAVVGERERITADLGQIQQILVNLTVNARDAMPQGGRLTIETADVDLDDGFVAQHPTLRTGPHVELAVSDNGVGMDAATKARLFEPFFTTKPKGQGTGLGLATVYGVVKQSGGAVWVYSEPGQGTTFKVYFPRTATEDAAGHTMSAPGQEIPHGVETILVIEDEDPVRNFIARALTRTGYTVVAMPSPAEAIDYAAGNRNAIDLILTDVVLPGTNGPAAVKRLIEIHPEARVLYMSGYTDDTVIRHGLLDAALAFLQKPFTADVLRRKVRDTLDTRATAATADKQTPRLDRRVSISPSRKN